MLRTVSAGPGALARSSEMARTCGARPFRVKATRRAARPVSAGPGPGQVRGGAITGAGGPADLRNGQRHAAPDLSAPRRRGERHGRCRPGPAPDRCGAVRLQEPAARPIFGIAKDMRRLALPRHADEASGAAGVGWARPRTGAGRCDCRSRRPRRSSERATTCGAWPFRAWRRGAEQRWGDRRERRPARADAGMGATALPVSQGAIECAGAPSRLRSRQGPGPVATLSCHAPPAKPARKGGTQAFAAAARASSAPAQRGAVRRGRPSAATTSLAALGAVLAASAAAHGRPEVRAAGSGRSAAGRRAAPAGPARPPSETWQGRGARPAAGDFRTT